MLCNENYIRHCEEDDSVIKEILSLNHTEHVHDEKEISKIPQLFSSLLSLIFQLNQVVSVFLVRE